jgi:purine-binding chemotaxis protein CheW
MSQARPVQFFVGFSLDRHRLALPVTCVERVIPVVEVTPLADAPAVVSGIVNFHGQIVAIYNLRFRFGLPERAPRLSDQIIVVRTPERLAGLPVDHVANVIEIRAREFAATAEVFPGLKHLAGVLLQEDGLFVIQNPAEFLSSAEIIQLDDALEAFKK